MSRTVFPKKDYYSKFSYENRILDALASCFHVTTPCTAVFKYEHTLYISYNSQVTTKKRSQIDKQLQIIFEAIINGAINDSLALYLLLNRDFSNFISKQELYEQNQHFKEKLDVFINLRTSLDLYFFEYIKTDQPLQNLYIEIVNSYVSIINLLKGYDELVYSIQEKDVQIKEMFLRPLQDVSKVLYKVHNGYKIDDYFLLDNKENLHAEHNIALHFPKVDLVDTYI